MLTWIVVLLCVCVCAVPSRHLDKAVLSSPNLQMFLYYHFFFSLAYTWFFALSYRWKYLNYADGGGLRVNFFTPAFFTVWAIAEASRIYVGYLGNLKEDVRAARWAQWSSVQRTGCRRGARGCTQLCFSLR